MSISFSPSQVRVILKAQMAEEMCTVATRESVRGSHLLLVDRAWNRFDAEMDHYLNHRSVGLSAVRKYHRLLIDAINSFNLIDS